MDIGIKKLEVFPAPMYFALKGEKGDAGEPGEPGPQGPKGDPGLDLSYLHEQFVPASIWDITHNLNKYCAVNVIDSGGSLVFGNVEYLDLNNIRITFSSAFSGKAVCN